MVCTKALIDKNNNPTRIECADAIKNSYCRCTSYKKNIDAIILAVKKLEKILKLNLKIKLWNLVIVTQKSWRVKIIGTAKYDDGVYLNNMIYRYCLRSAYPRAIGKCIDIVVTKKLDGVVEIIIAKDLLGKMTGHLKKDSLF